MKRLVSLLTPPVFENESFKTQVAGLLHFLCVFGFVFTIIFAPLLTFPGYQGGAYQSYVVITAIVCVVIFALNKRGYIYRAAALALILVSVEVMLDNFVSVKWISQAQILSVAAILLSGIGFGRRGFIAAMLFNCVGLLGAFVYRYSQISVDADRLTLAIDYFIQIGLLILVGVDLWATIALMNRLYNHNRQMTADLAERNKALEREVNEHQQAIEQNSRTAHTAREIINITHELLDCESMDDLWRRAIELAREQLDLDRCSIYLFDHENNLVRGTYGTDLQRQTTSEQYVVFPLDQIEWPNPQKTLHDENAEWRVKSNADLIDYQVDPSKGSVVAQGWIGEVAIRPRKGQTIGVFYCDAAISGKPADPAHLDLIALYCSLLGSIAERKQLTTRLDARTRELSHMLEISRSITSTLALKPLLSQVVAALKDVAGGDTATITEFINDRYDSKILCTTEDHNQNLVGQSILYDPKIDIHIPHVIAKRGPLIIPNMEDPSVYANAFGLRLERVNPKVIKQTKSIMVLPLIVRDRPIGICLIGSAVPYAFNDHGATLAIGVANQTAALIELVRAHEAEIKAAAKSERSRLARELHDSVSQSLFGIVLGLRTALQYMESKMDTKSTVQYALALAESGLSDIRALIFELRPEQLEKDGLVSALQKQVQAMSVRYKLDVTVNVPQEEPPLPLPAKEALYRIGMEALQNTMKHAQATKVHINLHPDPNVWTLDIQDNGRGFDPNTIYEGHYGLNTMRERADQLGATLNIISAPGAGARISVQVPVAQRDA